MPGTVRHELPPAKARPGATLRVRLELPEGWHLTEGAPSALRVEGGAEPVERRLESPSVDVAVPKGASRLTVRGIYYVCQDAGSCRVRSVVWTIPVAEAADGAERIEATDAFRP